MFTVPICSIYFTLLSTVQFTRNSAHFVFSRSAPSQPQFFLLLSCHMDLSLSLFFLLADLIQLLFRFSWNKFLAFIFLYSPFRSSLPFIRFPFLLFLLLSAGLFYFFWCPICFSSLCLMSFFVTSKVPPFPLCPNVYFIHVTSIRFQFMFSLPGFDLCFLSFQSRQT